jgi:cold shock CspA family protein
MSEPVRLRGLVTWFNEVRGFGFIRAKHTQEAEEEAGHEYFVLYDEVFRDGFKTLTKGETVDFTPRLDAGGPKAFEVVPDESVPLADVAD